MKQVNDSLLRFSDPLYLTAFNKNGYNNQPYFRNNQELFIVVQSPADTTQTEIYSLNLALKVKKRITKTDVAEYSPTLRPEDFGIATVVVEKNGIQRLWEYPLDRSNGGGPILPEISGIGYYHFLAGDKLALYITGEPSQLYLADMSLGTVQPLTENIGRTFQTMPNGHLAFVSKATPDTWYIKSLNPSTLRTKIITKTLPGVEDFALLPEGTILMGRGSKIYKYHPAIDKTWLKVADMRYYGLKNITRLAVSDNYQLAVVNQD